MSGNPYKDCCIDCKTGRGDSCHLGLNHWCHRREEARWQAAYLPTPNDKEPTR